MLNVVLGIVGAPPTLLKVMIAGLYSVALPTGNIIVGVLEVEATPVLRVDLFTFPNT